MDIPFGLRPHGILPYVLWNDKRGHQLVPLKCIKGAPTHSSFMLTPTRQNDACMKNDTNTMYISNFD